VKAYALCSLAIGVLPFCILCEKLAGMRNLGLGASFKNTFLKTTAESLIADESSRRAMGVNNAHG
jgi:hypothetical protein